MSAKDDALTPPARPFALLAANAVSMWTPGGLEAGFRRMGLQPEAIAGAAEAMPRFLLHLGALRVLFGRADAPRLELADPAANTTSLIGAAMPGGWGENCWYFEPEVADGAPSPAFLTVMVLLIDLFGADHLFWSPARLWSDACAFRGAIDEMRSSGMPPVLHLVAFRRRDGTDGEIVATRGLALFAGQELEAPVPAGWDMAAMVRRLARVAIDLMINGPIAQAQRVPGLESGEWVAMTPQAGEGDGPGRVRVAFRPGD